MVTAQTPQVMRLNSEEPTMATTPVPVEPQAQPVNTASTSLPRKVRWTLLSLAGAGLLSIGLLGGMLIGQQMGPLGMHNDTRSAQRFLHQDEFDHRQRVPDSLKERMKEQMKERMKEYVHELPGPQGPPNQKNG